MKRKYINDLKKWLDNPTRKPLIVWGARQVGKSYLIKDIFAEEYFKNNYIYIDFKLDMDVCSYCENHINPKDIISFLSLYKGINITKDTLLIFDEVQECLPIITSLKYFCQDYREIPLIVTGSMVRIKLQRESKKRGDSEKNKFLFPIGKINQLTIYPLNFEEYIMNKNELLYNKIKENYYNRIPLDDSIHKLALDCFYDYLLIGGMPEVVNTYLKTSSYNNALSTLIEIYDNYLADMDLYQASAESIIRSKSIFENIFSQLNKKSKNFKSGLIEKNAKSKDLRSPIDWLTLAFLINKSKLIKENVTLPLIDSDESLYRLYLNDMGMFAYQSKIKPTSFLSSDGRNSLSGIFFENYVSIELINSGFPLFYWKGKRDAEFEFIIQDEENIIPIDVKKNKGSLNSLEKFKEHNKLKYVVKISSNKYGYDETNKILTIPFYDVFLFFNELKEKNYKI